MTTLLTQTVARSTKPSFMPKTNNQPPKKFLSLALSCQKWQNSDFQSQFSMSKNIRIFRKKNSLKNMILGTQFLLLTLIS